MLRRIKLRTKLLAIVVLVVVLSGLSVMTVLFENGKIGTRADSTGSYVDIDNIVQARATSTIACNSNNTSCSYQVAPGDIRATTTASTVVQNNMSFAADQIDICIANATKNKIPTDLFGSFFTSEDTNGGVCSLAISKINDTDISITSGYKKNQNIATSFPLVYKSPASGSDFQGDAKLTSGNVDYDFKNFTSSGSYQNNKWTMKAIDMSKITAAGGINAVYEVKLNDSQNLLSSISSQNADFTFDPKSTWKFTTTGTLKGSINLKYTSNPTSGTKYNILSATFCPDGCQVTLNENLDIKAQKKGLSDNIKGTIISKATHSETYNGIGAIDATTHRIYWQDLTVKKNDDRSWSHALTYNTNTKVNYSGQTSAKADLQPIKNLSTITSSVNKTNQVTSSFTSMKKTIPLSYIAAMNQTEKSVNNKLQSRTGTGSYTVNGVTSYNGIYDTISTQLLINNSPTKSYLNTRRNPFSESPVSQYAPAYFQQGSIYVPGFFTALSSTATTTTLSTPARKDLPANFVVLYSFNKNDSVWNSADKAAISQLITDMKARGVNVTTYQTQTKKAMLDAFSKIPSGSWVLNTGHGLPNGLSAGNEFTTYAEIMQILKDKQIKIDVFAADSCYAGRAPLSTTVIGSIGPLYTNPSGQILQSPGSLFGNWNLASNDIVAALDKIAKQNAQASTPTSPPTFKWPFR